MQKIILYGIYNFFDSLVLVLLGFVFFDYVSGVLKAIVQKKLSSEIGAKGISRKILIFIIIAMSKLIDQFIINGEGLLKNSVTIFYICNEGISIIENAIDIGLPIPESLKNIIKSNFQENGKDHEE